MRGPFPVELRPVVLAADPGQTAVLPVDNVAKGAWVLVGKPEGTKGSVPSRCATFAPVSVLCLSGCTSCFTVADLVDPNGHGAISGFCIGGAERASRCVGGSDPFPE